MFTKVSHFFYRLFRSQHVKRWREFLNLTKGELRIALFIANHGNRVTLEQLTNDLTHIGGDPREKDSIRKIVDRMKERQKLIENKGYLSLKNPVHFILKQESISGSWFLAVLSFSILGLIISYTETEWSVLTFIMLLVTIGIILRILDEAIHETRW